MALNVNTNLGIERPSNIYAPQNGGIVSDNELTSLAKQILSATPAKSATTQGALTRTNQRVNLDVKLYEAGYDINFVKQSATNRTGYDLNLSQNALKSIDTLKAQAAQNQVRNITKAVDGKIHINSEKPDTAELKALNNTNFNPEMEVFQAANTNKDRRGPGGFYMPQENPEDENNEGLNLTI